MFQFRFQGQTHGALQSHETKRRSGAGRRGRTGERTPRRWSIERDVQGKRVVHRCRIATRTLAIRRSGRARISCCWMDREGGHRAGWCPGSSRRGLRRGCSCPRHRQGPGVVHIGGRRRPALRVSPAFVRPLPPSHVKESLVGPSRGKVRRRRPKGESGADGRHPADTVRIASTKRAVASSSSAAERTRTHELDESDARARGRSESGPDGRDGPSSAGNGVQVAPAMTRSLSRPWCQRKPARRRSSRGGQAVELPGRKR